MCYYYFTYKTSYYTELTVSRIENQSVFLINN